MCPVDISKFDNPEIFGSFKLLYISIGKFKKTKVNERSKYLL